MRTLQIDKRYFTVPASWRDLDADQLVRVAELADKGLSNHEFRIALLRILMGLNVSPRREVVIDKINYFYFRHGLTNEFLISEIDIAFITSAFDFMFHCKKSETEEAVYTLHYREVRNLMPETETRIGMLYGPADGLSNILLSEYIDAETAWSNFRKTGKYHFAIRLFAILYRPEAKDVDMQSPDYKGDRREPYNNFLLNTRTADLMQTGKGVIAVALLWYEACREFIIRKWPEVFEGGTTAEKTDAFTGFMRLVNSLASNDVTRTEQVRQSYLYDVMFTLQSIILHDRKLKETIKTPK